MDVYFSKRFKKFFIEKLSETDQKIIFDFKVHVEKYGLVGLKGRNKKSDHPNPKTSDVQKESEYAYAHKLWHYHIGIPKYETGNGFGQYTSKFVLHYQRFEQAINIVKMDHHSPFALPQQYYFDK